MGFPEHQFSRQYSAAAAFAALEEFTFASLSQRTMAGIFDVRMHYGTSSRKTKLARPGLCSAHSVKRHDTAMQDSSFAHFKAAGGATGGGEELTAQVGISECSICKTWYENAHACGMTEFYSWNTRKSQPERLALS